MLNLFRKPQDPVPPLKVDLHSHLLPDLDDGVDSLEESLTIIEGFANLGYEKLITTPHVMGDFYKNTSDDILHKLDALNTFISGKVNVKVEAAAEYYLDESFIQLLDNKDSVLPLGQDFVLFETSFMDEPIYLKEAIFKMQSAGFKPVLAHPERYVYLQNNWKLVEDIFDRGVYFQLNLNSLTGHYSPQVKKMASRLIKNGKVHFLGSDCHNLRHLEIMRNALGSKLYNKAMNLEILNDSLL